MSENAGPLPIKRLLGYARVSAGRQGDDTQAADLRDAGCERIHQDYGAEALKAQPILARLIEELRPGDMLVITQLDRLARSIGHLLELLTVLEGKGAFLRSLGDPVDTSTTQGRLALDMIGSLARLERAASVERTRAGMKAARSNGRLAGNPGLRQGLPEARQAISKARDRIYLDDLTPTVETWLPTVRQLRPRHNWASVVRILNSQGQDWTSERLRRAIRRLVREKLAEPELLDRSPRQIDEDRLPRIVAEIVMADPKASLREIAARLDKAGVPPARGGGKWQASSVRNLLEDARRYGFLPR